MRDNTKVGYDVNSMTTQSGFAFWTPAYRDSIRSVDYADGRLINIIPSGQQIAAAGELKCPYNRFELSGEFVWSQSNTRESVDGYQLSTPSDSALSPATVTTCRWGTGYGAHRS